MEFFPSVHIILIPSTFVKFIVYLFVFVFCDIAHRENALWFKSKDISIISIYLYTTLSSFASYKTYLSKLFSISTIIEDGTL